MTECNTWNVNLSNSQLTILKSGVKNGTEVTVSQFTYLQPHFNVKYKRWKYNQ